MRPRWIDGETSSRALHGSSEGLSREGSALSQSSGQLIAHVPGGSRDVRPTCVLLAYSRRFAEYNQSSIASRRVMRLFDVLPMMRVTDARGTCDALRARWSAEEEEGGLSGSLAVVASGCAASNIQHDVVQQKVGGIPRYREPGRDGSALAEIAARSAAPAGGSPCFDLDGVSIGCRR